MPFPETTPLSGYYTAPNIPTFGWDEFLLCNVNLVYNLEQRISRYVLVFRVGHRYYRLTTHLGMQITDLMQITKLSDINTIISGQASYILLVDKERVGTIQHRTTSFKDLCSAMSRIGMFEAL